MLFYFENIVLACKYWLLDKGRSCPFPERNPLLLHTNMFAMNKNCLFQTKITDLVYQYYSGRYLFVYLFFFINFNHFWGRQKYTPLDRYTISIVNWHGTNKKAIEVLNSCFAWRNSKLQLWDLLFVNYPLRRPFAFFK